MRFKIFKANSIIWLVCILLQIFVSQKSSIFQVANTMATVNMFVFLYFSGWVVYDYLEKNHSDDETSEN